MALAPCVALEEWKEMEGWVFLSEGSFTSPCNHQVLNSTIRSCYFVAGLWQESSELLGRQAGGDLLMWGEKNDYFFFTEEIN